MELKPLDSYKVGDKVEVLITDAKFTDKWVEGIVTDVGTFEIKIDGQSIFYPKVKVKYQRNYYKWRQLVLEFYEAECESIFYYESDIRPV